MARFDSLDYLTAWVERGEYPAIHRDVTLMVERHVEAGSSVVDLGSSTGLLTHRLRAMGFKVGAVEPNRAARDAGRLAGTYRGVHVLESPIRAHLLGEFEEFLRVREATALVARRVLPEVWSALGDGAQWGEFAAVLERSSLQVIVLEGRLASTRTVHPLGRAAAEVQALAPTWAASARQGNTVVLRRIAP